MILRHTTPAGNVASIDATGLLPSHSRGATQVVWLHAPRLTHWGILHIARRHQVHVDDVRVLTVSVPPTWVRPHGPGLWYCDQDIPPDRICGSPAWFASVVTQHAEDFDAVRMKVMQRRLARPSTS